MTLWLQIEGKKRRIDLADHLAAAARGESAGSAAEIAVDGRAVTADARMLQPGVLSLVIEGRQYRCVLDGDAVLVNGRRFAFAVEDPRSLQGRRGAGSGAEGPRPVKAPMPGRVVRVLAAVGDEVAEGQGIVVIEAMKMQNELKSPKAGRVSRIAVVVDATVGAGDVLAVVE